MPTPVPDPTPLGPPPTPPVPPPDGRPGGLFHGPNALWWRTERALRAVVYYPLVTGQIFVFILIAFGVVGGELGLEALFWHEHKLAQFTVGLSVGWLFGVALLVNLLLLRPDWVSSWDEKLVPTPDYRRWWPGSLFPARRPEHATVWRVGYWLAAWMLVLLAVVWGGKVLLRAAPQRVTEPNTFVREDVKEGFFYDQWGGAPFALGYLASMAVAWGLFRSADRPPPARPLYAGVGDRSWFGSYIDRPGAPPERNRVWRQLHGLASVFTLWTWMVFLVCYLLALAKVVGSPALLISLTLLTITTLVAVIAFRFPARVVFGGLVIAMFALNAPPMTLPNLNYAAPVDVSGTKYKELVDRQVKAGGPKDADQPLLLDSGAVLEAVKNKWQETHPGTKPRVVLIAVSGGGIRAAVWTGVVLEGLERELGKELRPDRADGSPDPDGARLFRRHVRLIAGASGGMVAAGAYAVQDDPLDQASRPVGRVPHLRPFSAALSEDALSPVVQMMVLRDFTVASLPRSNYFLTPDEDRGRSLEDAWDDNFAAVCPYPRGKKNSPFRVPVADLRDKQKAGDSPSLVFSPVFVEDTKRLLISNLDLHEVARPTAVRLDRTDETTQPCLEFFRLFPDAKGFTVGTAARLSASFPVVSPAVNLPLNPVRRAVDGGYFDNYGVDLVCRWLLVNKKAVEDHTSGVAVLQVRAFPLEKDGLEVGPVEQSPLDVVIGAVSAPAEAVLTARSMSAHHRNAAMLDAVRRQWQDRPDFFRTVVFELNQPAALSWYLTSSEKRVVVEGFYTTADRTAVSSGVAESVQGLKTWFGKGDGKP